MKSQRPLPAVASFGTRPAVEAHGQWLLEAHLLDWQGDAYGRLVQVEFLKKLRDEAHFDSLDALKTQIARDTGEARCHFLQHASAKAANTPAPSSSPSPSTS